MTKKLTQVSASQADAWNRCQRYWWFGWVDRIKRPKTDAMQAGTDIHAEIEHYLETGTVRDHSDGYDRYVQAAIPHLPDPAQAQELLVEHEFWLTLGHDLPRWLGYIDILHCDAKPVPLVLDTKTTSNFRYCKTPHELRTNTQLMSYCEYVYQMGHDDQIITGHLYIRRTPKRVPKKPQTKLVTTIVDRDHVGAEWARSIETVRAMVHATETKSSAHELPPTTTACGMYGGCPFRSECGLQLGDFVTFGTGTGKEKVMTSFIDRLRAKKAGTEVAPTPAPTPAPAQASSIPTGVVPPDAPPRETTDEESAVIRADAQRKADERAAKEEKATKKESSARKKKNGAANGANGFVLYIDCAPTKCPGDEAYPVLFEDWFAPVVAAMNEACQADKNVVDYRLLPYGEEKAMIAVGINEQIKQGLPPTMMLTSGTPGAKDALGQLVPHAAHVVRGK